MSSRRLRTYRRRQRAERRVTVSWLVAALLAAAVVAALAGCQGGAGTPDGNAAAPAGTAGAPGSGSGTGSAAKAEEIREDPVKTGIEAGDAGLAGRVRSRLAGDPQLRALPVEVDAEGGSVTLWGHVGRAEDRTAVEQVVRHTPGVAAVKNLIKVDAPAAASP